MKDKKDKDMYVKLYKNIKTDRQKDGWNRKTKTGRKIVCRRYMNRQINRQMWKICKIWPHKKSYEKMALKNIKSLEQK